MKKRILQKKQLTGQILYLSLLALTVLFLSGCSLQGSDMVQKDTVQQSLEDVGLVNTIKNLEGYTRVIGQEEYELYTYLVERDLGADVSEKEKEKRIKEYASQVNAVFYLGNRLDLYEPFSIEVLKMRQGQENEERRIKLENDEVVYGLREYDLHTYLLYEMSNLELDILSYIMTNITDEELGNKVEEYYYAHEESFRYAESITYDVTIGGETETLVADNATLKSMGNYDPAVADFLIVAEIGDTYEDSQGGATGEHREVVVTDIEYAPMGYENNKQDAFYGYIQTELYPELIQMVIKNNPLEYHLE